ncbi:MAG: LamG-like jellyroll fold domain-containing protein, partial [Candidatus Pacearchaeota archaeon]
QPIKTEQTPIQESTPENEPVNNEITSETLGTEQTPIQESTPETSQTVSESVSQNSESVTSETPTITGNMIKIFSVPFQLIQGLISFTGKVIDNGDNETVNLVDNNNNSILDINQNNLSNLSNNSSNLTDTPKQNHTISNETETNKFETLDLTVPNVEYNYTVSIYIERDFRNNTENISVGDIIYLDPTLVTLTVSSTQPDSLLVNVTSETNFTHLTLIGDTSNPLRGFNLVPRTSYLPYFTDDNNSYAVFNGTNKMGIQTGDASTLDFYLAQPFTQSAWVKIASLVAGVNYNIITMTTETGIDSNAWDKGLSITRYGTPSFYVYNGTMKVINSTIPINEGNWHHVAGVFNGTDALIYIDGVLNGSISASGTYNFASPQLVIGGNVSGSLRTGPFNGSIDNVMIHNRSLSDSEVLDLYNLGRKDTTYTDPSLVSAWRFDNSNISIAQDTIGVNNGTFVNVTYGYDSLGLLAYYPLDVVNSSNKEYDYSLNNYDGTLIGTSYDSGRGFSILSNPDPRFSAGYLHTCALISNGNINCWGNNDNSQSNNYTLGDAIGVSTGGYVTCALLSNGNVNCQGYDSYGQSNNYTLGDAIGVSAGFHHTCALLSNGNVNCWGSNFYGESNNYTLGDAIGVSAEEYHTCALTSSGNINCWGNNSYAQSNNYTLGNAIAVSTGFRYTCALLSNGNVNCWGDNTYGKSNNYTLGNAIAVSTGAYHTCALTSSGNINCWGDNGDGQANNYTLGNAIGVSAGNVHTCALTSSGNINCWGYNYSGQANNYTLGDVKTNSSYISQNSSCIYYGCRIFNGVSDYINLTIASIENSSTLWIKNSTADSWTFIAKNDTSYFVNGAVGVPLQYPINVADGNIKIGINESGDQYFNGSIDDIMLFNIPLNSSQILDIYNNQSKRFASSGIQTIKSINISGDINLYNSCDSVEVSVSGYSRTQGTNLTARMGSWDVSRGYNNSDMNSTLNGLVSYYHFDEDYWNGTAGEVKDAMGINNGSISGGVNTTSAGYYHRKVYFDGSNDYVSIPSNPSLNFGNGNFSISLWFNAPDETVNYPGMIATQGGWSTDAFAIRYDNTGQAKKVTVVWYPADMFSSFSTYENNVWTHVVVTRTGTNITLYVNGVVQGSGIKGPTFLLDLAKGGSTRLGGGNWDASNGYYKGSLDELMIFNRSISQDEVQELYVKGRALWNYSEYQNLSEYDSVTPSSSNSFLIYKTSTNILPELNLIGDSDYNFYTPNLLATSLGINCSMAPLNSIDFESPT